MPLSPLAVQDRVTEITPEPDTARPVMAAGALVSLSRELYTLSRRLDRVDLLALPSNPPM